MRQAPRRPAARREQEVNGAFLVRNPAAGQGISLRAVVVDKQGNTLHQTISNAYRGK